MARHSWRLALLLLPLLAECSTHHLPEAAGASTVAWNHGRKLQQVSSPREVVAVGSSPSPPPPTSSNLSAIIMRAAMLTNHKSSNKDVVLRYAYLSPNDVSLNYAGVLQLVRAYGMKAKAIFAFVPNTTTVAYRVVVAGKLLVLQKGSFDPTHTEVQVGLWRGRKGARGIVVDDELPGTWTLEASKKHPEKKQKQPVFMGEVQIEPGFYPELYSRPSFFFVLMLWPPFLPRDYLFALRGQVTV
eukprot:TRINITY_DN6002_c0_g1_i1.p1 TRINITY_DN6002_c0_g1~~TRINITY_DN6002_c0_g1_i1.p1  ORF type:complete len:243 (+),score=61.35 TRINITY_DN6002_c0_g1_i1:3-731(+)